MTIFSKTVLALAVATVAISTSSAENISIKTDDAAVAPKAPIVAKLLILQNEPDANRQISDIDSLAKNISISAEVFEGVSPHLVNTRRARIIENSSLGNSALGVVPRKKIRRSKPVVRKYRSSGKILRVASVRDRRALIKRRAAIMGGVYR